MFNMLTDKHYDKDNKLTAHRIQQLRQHWIHTTNMTNWHEHNNEGYQFIAEILLKICGPFWCKICGKNMRNLAKYALKYAAYMLHIYRITEICGVNDACACVYVGQNAQKCWKMRSHMRKYAIMCEFLHNLRMNKYSKCINKYSKFWKCHYMR